MNRRDICTGDYKGSFAGKQNESKLGKRENEFPQKNFIWEDSGTYCHRCLFLLFVHLFRSRGISGLCYLYRRQHGQRAVVSASLKGVSHRVWERLSVGGYHNAESVRFFGDMVFVSFCLQTVSVESVVSMGYDRGIIGAAYPVEIADAVGNYINRCDFKRGDYTDAVSAVFCIDTEHVSGGKKDPLCRVVSSCCILYDACQRADDADAAFVDAV